MDAIDSLLPEEIKLSKTEYLIKKGMYYRKMEINTYFKMFQKIAQKEGHLKKDNLKYTISGFNPEFFYLFNEKTNEETGYLKIKFRNIDIIENTLFHYKKYKIEKYTIKIK